MTTRRRQNDEEFGDEIRAHLELETDRLIAEGMAADEARAAARRAFGNVTQARERYYESRRVMWFDDLRTDVRHARRTLFRHPGFALVAVLTLAFGIGANTAIFSVVYAILLRPLPFNDAGRIVRIAEVAPTPASPAPGVGAPPGAGRSAGANANPNAKPNAGSNAASRGNSLIATPPRLTQPLGVSDLAGLRAQSRTLSHIGIHQSMLVTMSGSDGLSRMTGARLSASLLSMLGAKVDVGRVFDESDERAGAEPVAMIGHATWQRHFGGAPNVIGQRIVLDGNAYTIAGVMTRDFQFPDRNAQFWVPYVMPTSGPAMRQRWPLTARLKDGVSLDAAIAEINALIPRLRGDAPKAPSAAAAPRPFTLVPLLELQVAPIRPLLYVLAAAVGLVLLIACVNVANLLLARTTARQHELAVRRALGASRGRLIRAAMTESILLSLIGGAAGIALAFGGVRVLRTLGAALASRDMGPGFRIPRIEDITIDAPVLIFTAALALLAAIITGLAPALRESRALPIDALRNTTSSPVSGFNVMRRHGMYGLLVIAEIGMAVTLFVGSALLMHSFVKLSRVDPGYDPSGVITFRITLPPDRSDDQRKAFAANLVERFRALPGVTSAAFAESLPTVRQGRLARLSATAPAAPSPSPKPGGPGAPPSPAGARPAGAAPAGAAPPAASAAATAAAAREPIPGERPDTRLVSSEYLKTMGIRVVRGRGFQEGDDAGQQPVLLINQALARTGFLGANPIGTRIFVSGSVTFDPRMLDAARGAPGPWEIVGIVDDVHQGDLSEEAMPQIFVDYRQLPGPSGPPGSPMYFAVRTGAGANVAGAAATASAAAAAVTSSIRPFARQLDPLALIEEIEPMTQLVASSIAGPRFFTSLMTVFAALAVALAAIGIYGVMAYAVVRRTREIGIRMALGAGSARVLRLVLGQSLMLTTIGIVFGVMGAAAASRYLEGFLFGLTPLDPATFAAASIAFAAIATIAALVPARRATRVDPLISLRAE
jgi:predicted permease